MQFRVVPATSRDPSTPPDRLVLPAPPLPHTTRTRQVSLNEEDSRTVRVGRTATATSAVGATEVWEPYNVTLDAHPSTSTRSPSRCWSASRSTDQRGARSPGSQAARTPSSLTRRDHPRQGTLDRAGPVRLALPHRRTRRPRNVAALPNRVARHQLESDQAPQVARESLGLAQQ
jgi:hypothetical protein